MFNIKCAVLTQSNAIPAVCTYNIVYDHQTHNVRFVSFPKLGRGIQYGIFSVIINHPAAAGVTRRQSDTYLDAWSRAVSENLSLVSGSQSSEARGSSGHVASRVTQIKRAGTDRGAAEGDC